MDQNPPTGDAQERPADQVVPEGQPAQPVQNPYTPPPAYNPSPEYSGQGRGQPPGYPQQGQAQAGGPPSGYTPPGYNPQGAPPQGYPPPGYGPPPPGYPPPGYPPPGYGVPVKKSGGIPGWGWALIIVSGLLLIICVGIIAFLTFLGTQVSSSFSRIGTGLIANFEPVVTTTEFYTYLEQHDYEHAHSLLASRLASSNSVSDLRTRWEALESAQPGITSGVPSPGKVTGNTASVTEPLTSSQGKSYTVNLRLQKSGQNWEITGASPGLIPSP